MTGTWYKPGSFNRICDRTGFKMKAEQTEKEWNGSVVRRKSFELRHPQDHIRSFKDDQSVTDPRAETTNTFIDDSLGEEQIKPEDL